MTSEIFISFVNISKCKKKPLNVKSPFNSIFHKKTLTSKIGGVIINVVITMNFKKVSKAIYSAVSTLIVVAVAAIAVLLVGVRLLGYTPYAVISPSMKPTYNVSDLVYVKKTDPENVNLHDVITFAINDEGTLATHRVVEVNRTERYFRTKGDNNEDWDASPVMYEDVTGKVEFSIPRLGELSSFISRPEGKYTAIAVLFLLLLMLILPELFKTDDKNSKGDKDGKDDKKKDSGEQYNDILEQDETERKDSKNDIDSTEERKENGSHNTGHHHRHSTHSGHSSKSRHKGREKSREHGFGRRGYMSAYNPMYSEMYSSHGELPNADINDLPKEGRIRRAASNLGRAEQDGAGPKSTADCREQAHNSTGQTYNSLRQAHNSTEQTYNSLRQAHNSPGHGMEEGK